MISQLGMTRRGIVLAAMICAVAMSFIDQTIVAIALPSLQRDLGLSGTGAQWVVNAYLLSLAAMFAFGGRLADIIGHRRATVIGVGIFATASALCGLTPHGAIAEPWLIVCRIAQGIGGAILYPSALAIVVDAFPQQQRGRALAIFFGIAGGMTAIGPLLGGYLTEWSWRAIFWVNVPVALIALVLIAIACPSRHPSHWPHRLPRPDAAGRRHRAERVRLPAVGRLGLDQPSRLGLCCGGRRALARVRLQPTHQRLAAGRPAALP